MKSRSAAFVFLSLMSPLVAQNQEVQSGMAPAVEKAREVPKRAGTYIDTSLEVPVFMPPAPAVPKEVPEMRVDSSLVVPSEAACTMTLLRTEASAAPDLPVPAETKRKATASRFSEEELKAREIYRRRHTLSLGAMIYDHQVSVVHWQHPDTGESYEAICGFDIGLLAGIGRFVHAGETYDVMLAHTPVNTKAAGRLARSKGDQVPQVAADAILFTKGNPEDETGTAPIRLVKELLAVEKSRLVSFQAARETYFAASAAWEKAHPKVPKNETFWLRPHRGSRYLADPRPELPVPAETSAR